MQVGNHNAAGLMDNHAQKQWDSAKIGDNAGALQLMLNHTTHSQIYQKAPFLVQAVQCPGGLVYLLH
jgi:hypothetical protein